MGGLYYLSIICHRLFYYIVFQCARQITKCLMYTFRVTTEERGRNFDGWNWLLNWIRSNGLLQWNEDIKPEIALWRERELILLLCRKCESRAKKSLLNRQNLIIYRAVRQKFSLNKAIRRRQGFRNHFHLKHAHRFHPHEFNSLDFPLLLKCIFVKLIL